MRSWGWSVYTDVVFEGPKPELEKLNGYNDEKSLFFSTFTFSYDLKVNIKRFNEKTALSAVFSPTIGLLWVNNYGPYQSIGHYRLPLYAQYDIGIGAMKNMESKRGIGISAGFHYCKYGVLPDKGTEYFQAFIAPSFRFAYRYYSTKYVTREICITFDPPVNVGGTIYSREIVDGVELPEAGTNFTRKVGSLRLSIVKHLFDY